MEREPIIIPEALPDEIKESGQNYFKRRETESLKPVEGELEKTPEQQKFIELITQCVIREIESLDIEAKGSLTPNHIHMLTKEGFSKVLGEDQDPDGTYGFAHGRNYAIYINAEKIEHRLQMFTTILHEILHHFSHEKYFIDLVKRHMDDYRSGYVVYNHRSEKEGDHDHFYFLNEMVVNQLVQRIFVQNKNLLIKEFNITKEESEQNPVDYPVGGLNLLRNILKKIADYRGEEVIDIWKRFETGFFTGEMMHLRVVDEVYGKGSLRVLASIGHHASEQQQKLLKKYFIDAKDEQERKQIAEQLLNKKEFNKFKNIQDEH